MAVFNEPTQWDHTLGNNADTSTLPDDAAATAGIASLQKLFQIINATPLEAGGIAPDREDVNALFKYLGDQIFYTQNGGIPSYNASYDYIPGRVILYTDNKLYKCIQANGASSTVVAPDSVSPLGSDYWKDIENQDSTSLIPNQTIISELPLTDANLHLKDGALLSGSGAYSDYVDLIAEIYNGGSASSSFCTEAEWQTSNTNYEFCNKFVYDSVANTVRLPKVNSEHGALIKSYSSGTSWYRIYQDGWCEQGSSLATASGWVSVSFLIPFVDTNYYLNGSVDDDETTSDSIGCYFGLTNLTVNGFLCVSNAVLSPYTFVKKAYWHACGYIDISDLQVSPIYEYIVVGTVSKTDIQIDIDNVMTDLAMKADKDLSNATPTSAFATAMNGANIRTVVETYQSGHSWYRKYSDGWVEQGGLVAPPAVDQNITTNLIVSMRDTNYTILGNMRYAGTDATTYSYVNIWDATTTSFTNRMSSLSQGFDWYVCGYSA